MRLTVLFFCLTLASVAGCGIKPAELSPPPGKKSDFPRTYPDPSTDPQPEKKQTP